MHQKLLCKVHTHLWHILNHAVCSLTAHQTRPKKTYQMDIHTWAYFCYSNSSFSHHHHLRYATIELIFLNIPIDHPNYFYCRRLQCIWDRLSIVAIFCTDILKSVENIVVHTQYRRMWMKKGVNKEGTYLSWQEKMYICIKSKNNIDQSINNPPTK